MTQVYCLIGITTNEIFYIGETKRGLKHRLYQHLKDKKNLAKAEVFLLNDNKIEIVELASYRNGRKKIYADYYLAWKLHPEDNKEPDLMGLSYMGAQSVRMNINKILEQ